MGAGVARGTSTGTATGADVGAEVTGAVGVKGAFVGVTCGEGDGNDCGPSKREKQTSDTTAWSLRATSGKIEAQ